MMITGTTERERKERRERMKVTSEYQYQNIYE